MSSIGVTAAQASAAASAQTSGVERLAGQEALGRLRRGRWSARALPSAILASVTVVSAKVSTIAASMTEIACARRRPSLTKRPRWFVAHGRERGSRAAARPARAQSAAPQVEVLAAAAIRSPPALRQHDLGVERDQRRDRVVRRRRGDEIAGDGAAGANLRCADLPAGLRQRQRALAAERRGDDVVVRGERAERDDARPSSRYGADRGSR